MLRRDRRASRAANLAYLRRARRAHGLRYRGCPGNRRRDPARSSAQPRRPHPCQAECGVGGAVPRAAHAPAHRSRDRGLRPRPSDDAPANGTAPPRRTRCSSDRLVTLSARAVPGVWTPGYVARLSHGTRPLAVSHGTPVFQSLWAGSRTGMHSSDPKAATYQITSNAP